MIVSDFSGFFSRNHFLKGDFTFQWGGGVFQLGGFIFKWGGGVQWGALILMWGGGSKKNHRMSGLYYAIMNGIQTF